VVEIGLRADESTTLPSGWLKRAWELCSHTVPFDFVFPLVTGLAEADGNRTRLPALAGTPVLKTGGPTRRPDASVTKLTGLAH
jgi:hypothetical protein